jgi:hypothetical protein
VKTVRCKHLEAARLHLAAPRGLCFHYSAALCLDLPGSDVCIGTLRGATLDEIAANPEMSPVRFYHAWVEIGNVLVAPTLVDKMGDLVPINRASYYTANGVQDVKRLSRRQLVALGDVSQHVRTGRPLACGNSLGHLMLIAAGHRYKISEQGGVIPL